MAKLLLADGASALLKADGGNVLLAPAGVAANYLVRADGASRVLKADGGKLIIQGADAIPLAQLSILCASTHGSSNHPITFRFAINNPRAGNTTVTPAATGVAGSWSPTTVTLSSTTPTADAVFTPSATGALTVNASGNNGATAASPFTFTVDGLTFYISAVGNDSNDGQTTGTPWLTPGKIQSYGFYRGATYNFRGGDSFETNLYLADGVSGTLAADLITLQSYGTGQAELKNTTGINGSVIQFQDCGGLTVNNLTITGKGSTFATTNQHLINFDPSNLSTGTLYNLTVTNCLIRSCKRGISSYEAKIYHGEGVVITATRLVNVTISNNEFTLFWDSPFSIQRSRLYGDATWITGFLAEHNHIHDGGGNTHVSGTTAGGIVSCATGEFRYNLIHDTAPVTNPSTYGGGGPWCQNASLNFHHNEIYNTSTGPSGGDAGCINFDVGTYNSICEFNYCHDAPGPGFQGYQPQTSASTPAILPWDNNIVRYNVFQNCGSDTRSGGWGSISLVGETFTHLYVHNNTITMPAHSNAAFVRWINGLSGNVTHGVANVYFYNNIFYSPSAVQLFDFASTTGTAASHFFANNCYYTGGTISINWFGTAYTSIATWGKDASPVTTNPNMSDPMTAVTFNDPTAIHTLTKVDPAAGSPVIDAGADVSAAPFSYSGNDYHAMSVPRGGVFDIGAVEYIPAVTIHTRRTLNMSGYARAGTRGAI